MRILLIIVLVLGLLLTGLSICGIRVANEHLDVDRDVQKELAKQRPGEVVDYLAGDQEASIDDIDLTKKGWLFVGFAGATLFITGTVGLIIQKRKQIEKVAA